MKAFEYDNILPLVQQQQLNGRLLELTFACDATGVTTSVRQTVDMTQSAVDQTKHRVKRSFFNALRGPLSSAVRSIFGNSTAGRLAGDVASQVTYVAATPTSTMAISDAQRQGAIVNAFRTVADRFEWDGERWRGRSERATA